ncbi:MAG: bifunctional demethylmenaquinone methyltransferase/2-methoxy-6-polyprenyl-1,4-benzoquinol methylase UbiE [Phycisphaeraceae bacterium]|nr:bifunctional demethylmenaquinone methyltransferase/2-methoxy-6-polyprenyl-1,4-benzoquinol methylase UbiE [Phycisphaeraceae bacterium]MCW5762572.1 bifunctional demethylmenaquinone methyltransferase/2-methoxy-6-polyprenyl-1,4-benzoquinol methylase UbiE [Phycisphaeraceae bacterium]
MNSASKTTNQDTVWTDATLTDPHHDADKPAKVRAMFSAIARSYDLNNRVHSLGQDQRWRKLAVRAAAVQSGDVVADVACGTGDLTHAFARTPASSILGLDFTRAMLDLAEHKRTTRSIPDPDRIRYLEADAQNLPLESGSVDVVSIAFGIRNVQNPDQALAEFARVLRPGGRLVILEFDRPAIAPVRWFNAFYCGWVMPRTATLISRDRSGAYRYLPRSVESFMSRTDLESAMNRHGFSQISSRPLSLGICTLYRAVRSGPQT